MRSSRPAAAALALLLAAGGGATPDYGEARRSRNDRPYHGGAADVSEAPPASEPTPEGRDRGIVLLTQIAAACLGKPVSNTPVPSDPPTAVPTR